MSAKFRKYYLLSIIIFISATILPIAILIIVSFYKNIPSGELIALISLSAISIVILIFLIVNNIRRFRNEESEILKYYQAQDAKEKTYNLRLDHFIFLKGEIIENGDEIICSKTEMTLVNRKNRIVNQYIWTDWNYIKVELLNNIPFILLSKIPITRIDEISIRDFSGIAIANSLEMNVIIKLFSSKELDLSILEELEEEQKLIEAQTVCFGKNKMQIPLKIISYAVVFMLNFIIVGVFYMYFDVSLYVTFPICIFILWLPWLFFLAPKIFHGIKNARYTINPVSLIYSNGLLVYDFKWSRVRIIRTRGRKLAITYVFTDSEDDEEMTETFYILNDKRLLSIIYAIREQNQLEFDIIDGDIYE